MFKLGSIQHQKDADEDIEVFKNNPNYKNSNPFKYVLPNEIIRVIVSFSTFTEKIQFCSLNKELRIVCDYLWEPYYQKSHAKLIEKDFYQTELNEDFKPKKVRKNYEKKIKKLSLNIEKFALANHVFSKLHGEYLRIRMLQRSREGNSVGGTYMVKMVFVGDDGVGKTCIMISYANNSFPDDYVPTVFDNYGATVLYENKHVDLMLMDTAGCVRYYLRQFSFTSWKEDYDRLRPLSYPDSDVFLIVYDVTNKKSFENVYDKWYPELKEHGSDVPIILVGNKIDLPKDEEFLEKVYEKDQNWKPVTTEMGIKMQKKIHAIRFLECSARSMKGLKEVFQDAIGVKLSPMSYLPPQDKKICTIQ